jgi:hypothetical protein
MAERVEQEHRNQESYSGNVLSKILSGLMDQESEGKKETGQEGEEPQQAEEREHSTVEVDDAPEIEELEAENERLRCENEELRSSKREVQLRAAEEFEEEYPAE